MTDQEKEILSARNQARMVLKCIDTSKKYGLEEDYLITFLSRLSGDNGWVHHALSSLEEWEMHLE